MVDERGSEHGAALSPHRYPLWVTGFGIGVVIAMAYSLLLLPRNFIAAKKLRAAQAAHRHQHDDEATQLYLSTLELVPSSTVARIEAAEAIFSNNNPSDDETGLTVLRGVPLDKESWRKIARVIPEAYKKYFNEAGN